MVTWPRRCCEAVRSAILATAWLLVSILTIIQHLHCNNYDVVFCWILSHIGIAGNGKADQAAKSALNLPNITSYSLPYSHITSSIKKHLFARLQHLWHNSTRNKLHNIYSTLPISSKYPKAQLTRQEQTLYNRLRIGRTYLTERSAAAALTVYEVTVSLSLGRLETGLFDLEP